LASQRIGADVDSPRLDFDDANGTLPKIRGEQLHTTAEHGVLGETLHQRRIDTRISR
jgi:hypothetical protein